MKKLLEIRNDDELRKQTITKVILILLIFSLFLIVRITDKSFFKLSFYLEFIFLFITTRFYARAYRNKNYAFWGITLLIALYIFKNILNFTFVEYNMLVLYIAFLAAIFLGINAFVMSSPLYYPRVQWWEYDFRYRGELKGTMTYDEENVEVRLADLRRNCISILSFDNVDLGREIFLEIPFGSKLFTLKGQVQTRREVIPGRPVHYGLKLILNGAEERKNLAELKKVWKMHKKANLRRKFSEIKEANEDANAV